MPAKAEELVPCPKPWCASTDVEVERFVCIFRPGLHMDYAVVCQKCQCGTPVSCSKAEAITAWNTRAAQSPTEDEVGKSDALAKALCLLDTFAGEGLGHVYGNGQSLDADDVCVELAAAFGIECEPGWYRTVADSALRLDQIIPNSDPVETAGEVVTSVDGERAAGKE